MSYNACQIRIGSSVSAPVGPLGEPTEEQKELARRTGKTARRRRVGFTGVVIKSDANQKWIALWNDIRKCSSIMPSQLRIEGNQRAELTEKQINGIIDRSFVSNLATYVDRLGTLPLPATTQPPTVRTPPPPATTQPPAVVSTPTPPPALATAAPVAAPPPPALATAEPTEALEYNQANIGNDDLEENTDRFDPMSLIVELLTEEANGTAATRMHAYAEEKEQLIGTEVTINSNRGSVKWKVRQDIPQEEVDDQPELHDRIGLADFDFTNKTVKSPCGRYSRINMKDLLIDLWPGDWTEDLQNLNSKIHTHNHQVRSSAARKKYYVPLVSRHEFWR